MRTAKKFGQIESYHFYPEICNCPDCSQPLSRSHAVWSKTITTMNETAKVSNWGYRCRQESCSNNLLYRSAQADGIALKGYNFGLDVIVFIGQQRFNQHRNLSEIHQQLKKKGVQISQRRVSDYINTYELLLKCSQPDKISAQREQIIEAGGVRLAIDGVQPEQGKEILYIFRDVMSGVRFHAAALLHHDHKSLAKEMRHVDRLLAELELPLRSIISDNQSGIVKGVALVWPNILHQLCQIHYLKAIAKPISQSDSTLAKNLKKNCAV